MPKVTDTRIDDLIAHFEGAITGHLEKIHALDVQRDYHQARIEAAQVTLNILRNGNAPSEPQAQPDVPEKAKRTRKAKPGDLKALVDGTPLADIKTRVVNHVSNISNLEFANFNGTINSNYGLQWDNHKDWQREDWEKVLTVVEGKK